MKLSPRAWFSRLSARERWLIQLALVVAAGLVAPFILYRTADGFAADAQRRLAAARALDHDAAELQTLLAASAATPRPAHGEARDVVAEAARLAGLQIARVEPEGTALQVMFEPASALTIFRWIDGIERAGLQATRVALVRAGEGDLVSAQIRAAPRAS